VNRWDVCPLSTASMTNAGTIDLISKNIIRGVWGDIKVGIVVIAGDVEKSFNKWRLICRGVDSSISG
jgi:hypothetical protein